MAGINPAAWADLFDQPFYPVPGLVPGIHVFKLLRSRCIEEREPGALFYLGILGDRG
jgi:hypothetical protein